MNKVDWLIIDWGTTNFRAFAMNQDGSVVDKVEHNLGLLQVEDGQFASALEVVLKEWLGEYHHLPVYMAGMVGSAQGWVDVPYVEAPVTADALASCCHRFTLPWGAVAVIVPGVSYLDNSGDYEVMRGEEVQLFGLQQLADKARFVAAFPGTHSKHVSVEYGVLKQFATFMTGELFSLLSKYSILGRALPNQIASTQAFRQGVTESGGENFTSKLFATRTHRLFGKLKESEVLDYLSGLLIGQELKALDTEHLYLVGGEKLCARYQEACHALSISSTYINGDESFLAGLLQIKKAMNHD